MLLGRDGVDIAACPPIEERSRVIVVFNIEFAMGEPNNAADDMFTFSILAKMPCRHRVHKMK
jgi:hypothetical protein